MDAPQFEAMDFLKNHLRFKPALITYDQNILLQMIAVAKDIFRTESMLLEFNAPVNIVGDLHGQYKSLHYIFAMSGLPDRTPYLFLGDYVDRGEHQLETICCLLAWKINYPKQFRMLRGNHETRAINREYGFANDLLQRFGKSIAENLWGAFNDLFDYMPVAALINKSILCMHGGIGPTLKSLEQIRKIQRPLFDVMRIPVAQDLLWADPIVDMNGVTPNTQRGVSYFFGENEVLELCTRLNLDLIVRAHQLMHNGYGFFCGRKLVTVFSAPNYYNDTTTDSINMGAVMRLSADLVASFILFNPTFNSANAQDEFEKRYAAFARTGFGYSTRTMVEEGNNDMSVTRIIC